MRSRITGLVLAALVVASMAACADDDGGDDTSGSDTSPGASGEIAEGLKIAILPKQINNPYFDAALVGAERACEEIGAECEQVGPTEASGAAQVEFINTVIQQGYDALVISAADANAVVPAMKQAQDAGIAVVTYDADVDDPSARTAMIRPSNNELIGQAQVEWVAEALGDAGGEVAILSASATAANQNAWIDVMNEDLPNYPQLTLVETVYGDDDPELSAEKAAALFQSHPNLKAIIAPTTVGIREAAKYISGSQYKGNVTLTGLGLPSEMRAYVKDGTVTKFGLWDPAMLGYLGVYAAANTASEIDISDGFEAGGKTYELEEDGLVTVGPPQEFTADNIDDFQF